MNFPYVAVLAKRMKVWERRLMKDFHVAPVENIEDNEGEEGGGRAEPSSESALDRFRRISKQVASQSVSVKWAEVIKGATIEANSQIGRCRNRQSFKNQQNLLKAMEQARRLIERSPLPQSPNHSDHYVVDQTNQTLVALLKNISEEINEISPGNTLRVTTPMQNRSVTPLASLNAQLQTLISATPSPCQTRTKPKTRPTSPKPTTLNLRSASIDGTLSSTQPAIHAPKSPKPKTELPKPPFRVETPKSPLSKPTSILKNRSVTPDSRKSLDDSKSLDSVGSIPVIEINYDQPPTEAPPTVPGSPKLIDLSDISNDEPLKQNLGSPVKVIKRKAPAPQDIAVSRPTVPATPNQGMIPPPPKEIKSMQIPLLSTTPATPLPSQKPLTDFTAAESPIPTTPESLRVQLEKVNSPEPKVTSPEPTVMSLEPKVTSPEPKIDFPSSPMTAVASNYSSTEHLIPGKNNDQARSPSPACLRPPIKIDDVKTIKRVQSKAGWL